MSGLYLWNPCDIWLYTKPLCNICQSHYEKIFHNWYSIYNISICTQSPLSCCVCYLLRHIVPTYLTTNPNPTFECAEKNVTQLISWNVWFHVFRVNEYKSIASEKTRIYCNIYTVCPSHKRPQLVTCTCEEGSAWDPWSRSTEGVRGMVCAPPTSVWALETWRGRSSKLWKASRWWRRTPMGEKERGKAVLKTMVWWFELVMSYFNMWLQWTETYPSGPERFG